MGSSGAGRTGNPERYPDLAADLVRSSVDVIVAAHGETALAAKRTTQTIPIVVAASVDAVTEGLVVSLARPGGNITGLSSMIPELTPKRFELLKGIVPGLSRVALLWNPEMGVALLKEHEAAARSVGLEPRRLAVRTAAELNQAFLEATRTRCGAIVTVQNPIFSVHRTRIAQLALRNRLPAISGEPLFAEVGGLLTYGPNFLESWRRSAVYRRQDLAGRQASRPPRRTTHQVRVGDQPQDREDARPDDPAVAAAAGRPGHRAARAGSAPRWVPAGRLCSW